MAFARSLTNEAETIPSMNAGPSNPLKGMFSYLSLSISLRLTDRSCAVLLPVCFLRANYATKVATHRVRNRYIRRTAEGCRRLRPYTHWCLGTPFELFLRSGAVRDPKKEIALDGVKQRQTTQIQPQESQGHGRI